MRVTALHQKRKSLTAVVFEDGSELSLDSETVLSEGIKVGSEIDDIEKLGYLSDLKRAKSRALWYLSRADHSEKALFDKLKRGGFCEAACRDALDRMKELGLVDDERYAKRLCEYLSQSGVSNRELEHKLISKGIPGRMARELARGTEDESQRLDYLLRHKYSGKLSDSEGVKKVFAALIRKGFSYSDVRAAMKNYSEELEYSEDL